MLHTLTSLRMCSPHQCCLSTNVGRGGWWQNLSPCCFNRTGKHLTVRAKSRSCCCCCFINVHVHVHPSIVVGKNGSTKVLLKKVKTTYQPHRAHSAHKYPTDQIQAGCLRHLDKKETPLFPTSTAHVCSGVFPNRLH